MWTGAGDVWEAAGTWEGAVKGGGGGGIYRMAATHCCAWGPVGCRGEGVGGVQDAWIVAVVGWLHGQLVGGKGQRREG